MEDTFIDRDSTKVFVDNVLMDLDRRLDEDSFVQVPEESQSQRQAHSHSGQTENVGPLAKATPLGQPKSSNQARPSKHIELLEQLEESEQPKISE